MMKNTRFLPAAMTAAALAVTGCNGPGDTGGANVQTGQLLDSAVSGIRYSTETLAGVTGPDGSFRYLPGETVTFSVGDIDLPPVLADRIITPLDIALTDLVNDRSALNIARFLQAIDSDGNPDNGITIDSAAHAEAIGESINFDVENFQAEVSAFLTDLQASLPSDSEAKAHLEATIGDLVDGQGLSDRIRAIIADNLAGYSQGTGFLSSELEGSCQEIPNSGFAGLTQNIEICFESDGQGSASLPSGEQVVTWSVNGDGGVTITIVSTGATITLTRVEDASGNPTLAIDITGIPGLEDIGSLGDLIPTLWSGQLLDSAVGGIAYSTETLSGFTDADGTFQYAPGETITFTIGDIELPPVVADRVITPLDMTVSELVNDKIATNIARLLQGIDADGDPENGIQIDTSAHAEAINEHVDFNADDFDAEVAQYIGDLQANLPSADDARDHFERTISEIVDGKELSDDIRAKIGSFFADYSQGAGYLSSEFENSCQTLGDLLFGPLPISIEACFNDDGTGTVGTYAFTWSIDSDGGLLISFENGGTLRLVRLIDGEGNDAGAFIEIIDFPGAPDFDFSDIEDFQPTANWP